MKLGDGNTTYFHNALKERINRNFIDKLIRDDGEIVDTPLGIEVEVLDFYPKCLGSK